MGALDSLLLVRINATDPDPAVDQEKTGRDGFVAYMTDCDSTHLTLVPNVAPVLFEVRRLPAAYLTGVLAGLSPVARRLMAFRAAVHRITQGEATVLEAHEPTGAPKDAVHVCTRADYGATLAPEPFVQAVADAYGAQTLEEMGQRALDLARLPRGKQGPFGYWGS